MNVGSFAIHAGSDERLVAVNAMFEGTSGIDRQLLIVIDVAGKAAVHAVGQREWRL